MKNQVYPPNPRSDEVRAARIAGFTAATSHLSPEKRDRLLADYIKRDARREEMVTKFILMVRG